MTIKITWERDADGLEGYVGTDEAGQWWGRVDVDAEPLGPHSSKDAAIEAYEAASPEVQAVRQLMREACESEPPEGWEDRLEALWREERGED